MDKFEAIEALFVGLLASAVAAGILWSKMQSRRRGRCTVCGYKHGPDEPCDPEVG